MDYSGITTFKKIAIKYLHGSQRPTSDYKRVIQFVINGYRDVALFNLGTAKDYTQMMDDISCISIPDDYMRFISLSVVYKGRKWILTKDGSLISPTTEVNGTETNNYTGELEVENTYGTGGGRNDYYYKVEEENRRIIINGLPKTLVTLTYKSTGISMTEETAVPLYTEPALLAFIGWKMAENEAAFQSGKRYSAPLNNVMYYKNNYLEEASRLDNLRGSTIDEIYDAIYSTWKQTAKR